MAIVQLLRDQTRADHDAVDARYGGFALDDRADYARFLLAHARALPAVEPLLEGDRTLPRWRERTTALGADLAALGHAMPAPLPFALAGEAERWGALYVTEGSRLGGTLLARGIPAGLPSAYLGARHLPGEWRALLAALETAPIDPERAVAGARVTFALYAAAAGA